MLSRCFWGFSVGVGAFIIGLSQTYSFFSLIYVTEIFEGNLYKQKNLT